VDLTDDERRVLRIVADAGEAGVDAISRTLAAQGRDAGGTWWVGPFMPPWFMLREVVDRLADLGLVTVEHLVRAASYGETRVAEPEIPVVAITEAGRAVRGDL
jgi:hypothetical protein